MRKFTKYITAILISSLVLSFSAYADTISDTPFGVGGTETTVTAPSNTADTNAPVISTEAPGVQDSASATGVSTEAPGTGSSTSNTSGSETDALAAVVTTSGPEVNASASTSTTEGPTASSSSTVSDTGSNSTSVPSDGNATSSDGPGGASGTATTVSSSNVPGADHAGDAVTRIDLGFTVVSPAHEYNGYKVAEGSVQLSDGTWASIDYQKYIKQPYYRLLREDGDWYVVSVNASRIGNYYVGSKVTELWLKKSDCTVSNYIEVNTTNPTRINIVKSAMSLLGKGYRYAGNGPDEYDCSGLVNAVMTDAGISIARTSSEICQAGTQVGIGGLRPGDIVGRPGHVGIYIGNGYFVHAAESSVGVISDDLSSYNSASSGFTSYANVVGD